MKTSSVRFIWILFLAGLLGHTVPAGAQVNQYWDPNGTNASPGSGGTGTWNSANTNWWVSGSSDSLWTNDNIAVFAGTSGTVTMGAAETANGITFSTSNYTISGSSILTLAGTPVITIPAGTNIISCPLAGTVPVTVSGPGLLELTHSGGSSGLTGLLTISSGSSVGINGLLSAGVGGIALNGTLYNSVGPGLFTNPITGSGTLTVLMPYNTASENLRYSGTALAGFTGTVNMIAGLSASNTPGAAQIIMTNAVNGGITWNVGVGATLLLNPLPSPGPFVANQVILNGPGNSQSPGGALRLDSTALQANVLFNGAGITIGDENTTTPSSIIGVISDGGNHYGFISVVKTGETLVLEGANTYTGPTIIGGNGGNGTVQVAAAETPGTSGPLGNSPAINPGNIVFAGGTFEYSSTNTFDYSGRFSTNAGQAYIINLNGQPVTFARPLVSSGGALTLSDSAGGGTLTLSATNTYNGITTVNTGTLNISGSIAGTVINVNGGTLQLDSATTVPSGTILTLPSSPASGMVNLNFNGVQNITTLNFGSSPQPSGTYGSLSNASVQYQNAAFVGNGVLNVQPPTYWDPGFTDAAPGSGGNGNWDSISTNWFIGTRDTTWVSNNVANFAGNAGTVMLNANESADGLTFDTSGYIVNGSSVLTLGGTPIITVASGTAEVDCSLAGTAGLIEAGSGALTLGGANTFSGAVTIGIGNQLTLNGANAFAGPITMGIGSTITVGNAGNLAGGAYPGAIGNNGIFTYNSSATQSLSGIMSGGGSLDQEGPGPLTTTGLNTFTGGITINNATLTIGGAGDLGNNPTFNVGGYAGSIVVSTTFIYSSSAAQTLSGNVSGPGGLIVNGSGVLTLTAQNGYGGPTTIGAGSELIIGSSGSLGDGDYGNNITNNGTLIDQSSVAQIVEGAISGSGSLTQSGTAIMTLNGTNTYTGATTISSGQLVLGANASIRDSASISIAANTIFDVSATPTPFTLSTSNSLIATGSAGASGSINGPSSGTVSFGSQPISLTFVPQTFTGDTSDQALTISQGALVLNGNSVKVKNSGSSPLGIGSYTLILVNSGTISGNATLNGSVTGAGLAAGTVGSLSATNGALSLVVATAPTQPGINSVARSGGNLIFSGTNGPANGTYVVLMTTNVALPFTSWTPVSTNTFSGTGTFSVTNAITGTKGFFAIEVP